VQNDREGLLMIAFGNVNVVVSFDTWPKPGRYSMSSEVDTLYQEALKGKTYMMGISPYFFTS